MKNKVLIELVIPEIDERFNIYIPVNRKVGNVIELLNKSLYDLTSGIYGNNNRNFLYDQQGEKYPVNVLIKETNIRNGSVIVLF